MSLPTHEISAQRPSPLMWMIEGRAFVEYLGFLMSKGELKDLPRGDGHPVMVLPGWLTSDFSTRPLRGFLNELGYAAHGWGLGRNLIATEEMEKKLAQRVEALTDRYGTKVSLIGWSAGGIYARALAHQMQDNVRQVITMGSPFRGIKGSTSVEWLYEWVTGELIDDADQQIRARASTPPPVPTTSIYSKGDGIVHWEVCRDAEEGPMRQNFEVKGSHTGLGHNTVVLKCIADRLSLREGDWRPYAPVSGEVA